MTGLKKINWETHTAHRENQDGTETSDGHFRFAEWVSCLANKRCLVE